MTVIAKSQSFDIRFFSLEKTAAIIDKAAPSQKIFLICKNPQDVKTLVDKGVEIKDLNVGNMHQSEGKKQISTKVYADDAEIDCLNYLYNKGINILPIGYTFLLFYFLRKKHVSPIMLIVVTFVLALILSLLGIL